MAKSKAQPARAEVTRRRHATKADAERWSRIFLIGGVVAAILIAAGVIAFGWYQTQIRPLGKTVLQVSNSKYSLGYLERRMRLLRTQDPTYGAQATSNALLALPDAALNQIEREAKLLVAAPDLNITATDEEVAQEISSRGNLAADVEPSVYASEFSKQVHDSGLKESDYVQTIRAYLLGKKTLDYFRFVGPDSEPQVRGQYILFDDATKASQGLQLLQAGGAFDQVAGQLGISSSSGIGQALTQQDWTPRTDTAANQNKIQAYLFNAQPDQISDVITIGSYYIVAQLLERDDNRALDDKGKQSVASRQMNSWFDELDAKLSIKKNLSTADSTRALSDVLP